MVLVSICAIFVNAEDNNHKSIKKVVSIVYDDSGSMNNKNEDWAYASYSLQNLIGLLNNQDELSVVKMSNPNNVIDFDLSNDARNSSIKDVEMWSAPGQTTPFSAVNTAADWIKERKSGYSETQSVEFWFVILTDGAFESGYPDNMPGYLSDLKGAMGNSKFESIFVAIGNDVPANAKNDWTSVAGNHLITASNSEDILNAMSEVSGLILGQGGKSTMIDVSESADRKSISFNTSFPLKKFIVFQQNQNANVLSIDADGVNAEVTADFCANKPGNASITSRTIHCESTNGDYIPDGKITINFDSQIDTGSNKFKILTESAVNVDLKVLDKSGNEISDINNNDLVEGDLVEFEARITSRIDNSPINLQNWANDLSAQLIVNDQIVKMSYDSNNNAFYGSFNITGGSNIAYAIVALPGYFRAKSDVLNIYPIEVIDNPTTDVSNNVINVTYKYCSEYEEVASFTYTISGGTINGICDFKFNNVPKGITASVNGVFVNEDGCVSVKIHNDIPADVKFYRNKDYKETESSRITIDVTSKQYVLEWKKDSITEIILNPTKRNITLESVNYKESDDLKLNNFNGKIIYYVSVLGNDEYLSSEELESLNMTFNKIRGISFISEIVEYNGRSALQIKCKKKLPEIFVKTGNINACVFAKTIYDEQSENVSIPFRINDSPTKYIMPLLLLIIMLLLLGHAPGIKNRIYNNKYHILVNGKAEEIYVKPFTRFVPFISEKGSASDLAVVATSNKNRISIKNNFYNEQDVFIDGEKKEKNVSKFDLPLGSELKIIEPNRETRYEYCNSKNDDSFGDDFDKFYDTDDMFGEYTESTTSNSISVDEFFS